MTNFLNMGAKQEVQHRWKIILLSDKTDGRLQDLLIRYINIRKFSSENTSDSALFHRTRDESIWHKRSLASDRTVSYLTGCWSADWAGQDIFLCVATVTSMYILLQCNSYTNLWSISLGWAEMAEAHHHDCIYICLQMCSSTKYV